jgi:small redox-active disulfide protein 2
MKIEVLGTGCAKCNALEAAVKHAADSLGFVYEFEHVKDLRRMTSYGVMVTPALVIDGQVRVTGRVPSHAELTTILTSAAERHGRSA